MIDGYIFNWSILWRFAPQFFDGVIVALEIFLLSTLLALVISIIIVAARVSSPRILSSMAFIYIELMRNSPSLVKMYFLYFGLPYFGVFLSPFWAAVIALALHNASYMAEILRGGFLVVPNGEIEAAKSTGMSRFQIMLYIVGPQTFYNSLPGLGNNLTEIMKDTSLTGALSVEEIFFTTTKLISATQRSFEFLALAALTYLILTSTTSAALRYLESRAVYKRRT